MQLSLLSQILAENELVQQLRTPQEAIRLLTSLKRLKQLVYRLHRIDPTQKGYCLAFTILSMGLEKDLAKAIGRPSRPALGNHQITFERLQYQTNLAVSILI